MSAVAAAIGASALVGGISANSAADASRAQDQAATRSQQLSQGQYDEVRQDLFGYRGAGQRAEGELERSLPDLTRNFTMADFHQDPGYQFQLGQGQLAMSRSAAASGMLNSEGTQQRLNDYSQGMANTSYQQALQNFTANQNQRYNMLAGVANGGLSAIKQGSDFGINTQNNMNNAIMGGGNAQAAGIVGQGNALSNAVNTGANMYMQNQYMRPQMPGGMAGGGGGATLGMGASAGDNMWAGADSGIGSGLLVG